MPGDNHSNTNNRLSAHAGRFYSADSKSLRNDIESLLKNNPCSYSSGIVRAIIAPHAGYVYSGPTAAVAYNMLNRSAEYDNIFLIGSSHRHRYNGAAIYSDGNFITPLGEVIVNSDLCNKLIREFTCFTSYNKAHLEEHSLEVQLPFLQYIFGNNMKIVPILIGTDSTSQIKKISESLRPWFNSGNLFIVSTDFSHFPEYNEAVKLDNLTLKEFLNSDAESFAKWILKSEKNKIGGSVTPMCGWTSGVVLKFLQEKEDNLTFKHLSYSNSGDSKYGEKDSVVGYHSIALIDDNKNSKEFYLSEEEKQVLLKLARDNIENRLQMGSFINTNESDYSAKLKEKSGAFVTLKIDGKLRGCIGRITATDPLFETIKQMSASAAFSDSRFDPVKASELDKLSIEISVLSIPRKIESPNEIVIGKHGVLLKKESVSATFLPQVAIEQGWSVEKLLGHLSKDKAGLGWESWKESDLFVYEALVFGLEQDNKF